MLPGRVDNGGVSLHVEADGSGDPVTVFAHGLTNSCAELAALTPLAPGTSVRFCFRGHGHSSVPPAGAYAFADFASDLDAVAEATGAVNAVGTSLGAGALANLLGREPDRFRRLVFLLPAVLDEVVTHEGPAGWDEALPEGVARAVQEVTQDLAIDDRERLRAVTAPAIVIACEGDALHPAGVARNLAAVLPDAELVTAASPDELMASIPALVQRVGAFLRE